MASTLQNIIAAIRDIRAVDPINVNYGWTDNREPPYVNVLDYQHTITYDTHGPAVKDATYTVQVVDKSQDAAETIAARIDDVLNASTTLTPTTMRNLQESYKVGQMDEKLYQFGVQIGYSLKESINP